MYLVEVIVTILMIPSKRKKLNLARQFVEMTLLRLILAQPNKTKLNQTTYSDIKSEIVLYVCLLNYYFLLPMVEANKTTRLISLYAF